MTMLDYPTTTTVRERAEAGATFLDANLGKPEWVLDINLTTLDLKGSCTCVLGQEFGNYFTALDVLGLSNAEAQDMGFILADEEADYDPYVSRQPEWDELTEAWREVLAERRAAMEVTT